MKHYDHDHCSCDCEHPQPFRAIKKGETEEKEWCGACWHYYKTMCPMIPCTPLICKDD